MKKVFAVVLALLVLFTAAAMAENVVKIGVFEPSSGDNGAGGKQEVLGIQYANSLTPTVTIGGEEYKVELVIVDNQSSTDKGATAAQELVSKNVSIVLGSYGSGVSMAGGTIFEGAGIPAIGLSCTNPNVTATCDYYWRICFLDPFQGTVMANFAVDQFAAKKAYVLTQLGDDYSTGLGHYFKVAFEKLGGEVVEKQFPEGTSDFTAYIAEAINEGVNVVFAPSSTTSASLIINTAAAQGMTCPVLAGDTWESSVILEAVKGTNVEVYCSTFFDENDASAAEFVNGIKAWMNANPDMLTNNGGNDIVAAVTALGYDGYNTAIAAMQAADSVDPDALVEALPTLVYDGAVTGSISFDETGDAKKDMAYIKKANGNDMKFEFVKTQNVADLGE